MRTSHLRVAVVAFLFLLTSVGSVQGEWIETVQQTPTSRGAFSGSPTVQQAGLQTALCLQGSTNSRLRDPSGLRRQEELPRWRAG